MKSLSLKNVFLVNSLFFFFFVVFFFKFPEFDIFFSKMFFYEEQFISERFVYIKQLRSFLKNLMIIISIASLFLLLSNFIYKKKKKNLFSE